MPIIINKINLMLVFSYAKLAVPIPRITITKIKKAGVFFLLMTFPFLSSASL
ncbi:MAG: hypothetical protein HY401_09790 [Elusimicrobia bacterium]|nr:hypothetical protein [Elusimicrobiota bacterium]